VSDDAVFRFEVPKPPGKPVVELSAAEAEQLLLQELEQGKSDNTDVLWQLAQLYKLSGQPGKALERLQQVLERLPDPQSRASCAFTMGQAMERVGDFPSAIAYYREALAAGPTHTFTRYFVHNNLGFSLNALGRFIDGEACCRKAIDIEPGRPNAHKNLGIALKGQGCYREAAEAFVNATRANAADPRAFYLLRELLTQHPELEREFRQTAELCGKAVEMASRMKESLRPAVVPPGVC
jgi:tetratricopeptide (TPR) repeat protein